MREPIRTPEELASDLFEVGRDERPTTASRDEARAALGLSVVAIPHGATAQAAGAGKGSAFVLWKTVGLALVGGIAIGFLASRGVTARNEEPVAGAVASVDTRPAAPPAVASNAPIAEATPTPASAAPPAITSVAPKATGTLPAPAPTTAEIAPDTLASELKSLEETRARLAAGDPTGALAKLSVYEKSFPRGALRNEATVLRIEALVKAGRRDEAKALGETYLRSHATDVNGQRVRRLLDAP
jgi:hypothetical protein